MDLGLGLDLISTACKHLLLLLCKLPRLHLLHVWLLTELELWILAHLHEGKSLINISITSDITIGCEYILLHHLLGILLHYPIRLGGYPVLIFALAPRLLVMDSIHLNLIILGLL